MKEVSAAIIIENGKVLLARRAEGEKLAGFWEFPGGKREDYETIEQCLVREIQEELALDVRVLSEFGISNYKYPGGEIRLIALLCEICGGTPTPRVHDAVVWVSISDLLHYQLAPADVPLAQKIQAYDQVNTSSK